MDFLRLLANIIIISFIFFLHFCLLIAFLGIYLDWNDFSNCLYVFYGPNFFVLMIRGKDWILNLRYYWISKINCLYPRQIADAQDKLLMWYPRQIADTQDKLLTSKKIISYQSVILILEVSNLILAISKVS